MTTMIDIKTKGLDKCWLEDSLNPDQLHLHITEIPAGTRPHPPHAHSGVEAFYVLEGSGAIETENGTVPLEPNQAVILDAKRVHGLVNTGSGPMKYIVIIAKP
jgi:mannose-6-phosphate isomerase-like protein (cupin superfamily)